MPFVTVTVVIRMLTAETALNTGQLVKDQDFTLFDAVGALEVCNLLYSSAIASTPLYAWNTWPILANCPFRPDTGLNTWLTVE